MTKWGKLEVICPDCGEKRLVRHRHILHQRHTGRCKSCNGKFEIRKARRGRGPESSNWRGGRLSRTDGYTLVMLRADDPFFPMVRRSSSAWGGYVREHRLVMARKLGRCLRSDEIVHHLNRVRDDNREENLVLTTLKTHLITLPSSVLIAEQGKRILELEEALETSLKRGWA